MAVAREHAVPQGRTDGGYLGGVGILPTGFACGGVGIGAHMHEQQAEVGLLQRLACGGAEQGVEHKGIAPVEGEPLDAPLAHLQRCGRSNEASEGHPQGFAARQQDVALGRGGNEGGRLTVGGAAHVGTDVGEVPVGGACWGVLPFHSQTVLTVVELMVAQG